jgi:hypothetical protein
VTTGDLAWGALRGGRLTRAEELRYLLALVRPLVGSRLPRRTRTGRTPAGDVALVESPPDSAFARTVYRHARELSPPGLLAHCLRTWLLADLRGRTAGIRHDTELLYAACLLHDLGLTDAHAGREAGCFAVEGGRAARALAVDHGYPRAAELGDAISLHLQVSVPVSVGAEAHLLQAGAFADLVGGGPNAVPRSATAEADRRHPRDRLEPDLVAPFRRQAGLRPRSRAAVLERRAGFTGRIR